MTIYGDGYVAKLLKNSNINFLFDIYAKGISNSVNASQDQCQRDINSLKEFIKNQRNSFLYISSSDLSNKNYYPSEYINHKKKCESIVLSSPFSSIVRISQIVGNLNSKTALLNYFAERILNESQINIHFGRKRFPISSEDVIKSFSLINKKNSLPKIIDLRPKQGMNAEDIVSLMMKELKASIKIEQSRKVIKEENEEEWENNILYFFDLYPKLSNEKYCENIIKNYIKNIIHNKKCK